MEKVNSTWSHAQGLIQYRHNIRSQYTVRFCWSSRKETERTTLEKCTQAELHKQVCDHAKPWATNETQTGRAGTGPEHQAQRGGFWGMNDESGTGIAITDWRITIIFSKTIMLRQCFMWIWSTAGQFHSSAAITKLCSYSFCHQCAWKIQLSWISGPQALRQAGFQARPGKYQVMKIGSGWVVAPALQPG